MPQRASSSSSLMRPFVVLALPGMYLLYKYNQYRQQQMETARRRVTERELMHLNTKIKEGKKKAAAQIVPEGQKALPAPVREPLPLPAPRPGVQVSVLGAETTVGQYTSLLLKQCPCIKKLRLYEAHCPLPNCDRDLCQVVEDLQHINTNCHIQAFSCTCCDLERCLQNTDLVLIMDGGCSTDSYEKRFSDQAATVKRYADVIANECPKAFVIVAATPIDCMVPLMAKALSDMGWYSPRRLLGSLAVPEMRASTLAARALCLDPSYCKVPCVGGTEGGALVPLFSKAVEYFDFTRHNAEMLTETVRTSSAAVTRADGECVRAAELSEAHALAGLVSKVANALICTDIPHVTGYCQMNPGQDKLLNKLEENEPELASSPEEECVICVNAKATMQTSPCGHRVVCRRCFVKTIQMAVSQRLLPLRCVICRAKILRLRQAPRLVTSKSWQVSSSSGKSWGVPGSVSSYSVGARSVPASASLYSVTSGESSLSGVSSVSSNSGGNVSGCSTKLCGGAKCGGACLGAIPRPPTATHKPRQPASNALRRSQQNSMKARLQEYQMHSYTGGPAGEPSGRLPPIREFQRDFREGRRESAVATCASTRIRCAQKIVTQLETSPQKDNQHFFRPFKPLNKDETPRSRDPSNETDKKKDNPKAKPKKEEKKKKEDENTKSGDKSKKDESSDNKKNEIAERKKEEKLRLKAEKEAKKEAKLQAKEEERQAKLLAKEEERQAKLLAKEEKKKAKKEAKLAAQAEKEKAK